MSYIKKLMETLNWKKEHLVDRLKDTYKNVWSYDSYLLNAKITEYIKPDYKDEAFKLSFYFKKGDKIEHVHKFKTKEEAENHLKKIIDSNKKEE